MSEFDCKSESSMLKSKLSYESLAQNIHPSCPVVSHSAVSIKPVSVYCN